MFLHAVLSKRHFFSLLYTTKKCLSTDERLETIKKKVTTAMVSPLSRLGGLPEVLSDVDERLAEVNLEFCAAEVVVQLLPPFLRSMLLFVNEPCSLGFVEQRVHDVVLLSAQPRHAPGQHVALRVHELAKDQDVRVVYELDSKSA